MGLLDIYATAKPKMAEVLHKFGEALKTIHTGRASSLLVEDLLVSAYGSTVPMKQVATIATPEATLVMITPWDKSLLGAIEAAVRESGRNLNPTNDGTTLRITLPPMSQERREEMVKLVNKMAEESRVALRTIRKEAWEAVQQQVRASTLTEDDKYDGEKDLNKMIEEYNGQLAALAAIKEKAIMSL